MCVFSALLSGLSRSSSSKVSSANHARSRIALLAGSAAVGLSGYGIYKTMSRTTQDDIVAAVQAVVPSNTLSAAETPKSQDSVSIKFRIIYYHNCCLGQQSGK